VTIKSTSLWKQVWDPIGLPKVNFFFWILMHKKALTGENMITRGIVETMDHFLKKLGRSPSMVSKPQLHHRLQLQPFFPLGRRDILKRYKANQYGKEFGRPY
jgi:hypothetical protein